MSDKFKILCLHGYRQNREKFNSQTGAVRKILKPFADFVFISAPHIIPNEEGEQRSWWFTKHVTFSSKDESDDDTGFDESLKLIEKTFKEEGPFHGILGFSQGAAFTALLCALKQKGEISIDFKFAIIVSGFKSKCSKHFKYYNEKINIPSLHVIGETDQVIDQEWSKALAELFTNSVVLTHSGGHYVPGVSSLKAQYLDFMNAQREVPLP